MTTVPSYTEADEYHALRQTKSWINLGDSTKVAVQKAKTAALTKAMDYIEANYNILVGDDADIQGVIDAKVQQACIMLAAHYATATDELESTPEVVEKELQSGEDKIKTKYAVDQTGYSHQERFPTIRNFLEPVMANPYQIKVVR